MKLTFGKPFVNKVFKKSKTCYVYKDGVRCGELTRNPSIIYKGCDDREGEYVQGGLEYTGGTREVRQYLVNKYPEGFRLVYCAQHGSDKHFSSMKERLVFTYVIGEYNEQSAKECAELFSPSRKGNPARELEEYLHREAICETICG